MEGGQEQFPLGDDRNGVTDVITTGGPYRRGVTLIPRPRRRRPPSVPPERFCYLQRRGDGHRVKRTPSLVCVLVGAVLVGVLIPVGVALSAASASVPALVGDPAGLVNPFAGTGSTPVAKGNPGNVGEFPGADLPFGMIQWSPDTTPNRVDGSGYSYADSHISGFSLTHMSGTGCASYGDVPVLPTVGPIGAHPARTSASFSHADERGLPRALPGGPGPVEDHRRVGRHHAGQACPASAFPATGQANVLFKVSGQRQRGHRVERPGHR